MEIKRTKKNGSECCGMMYDDDVLGKKPLLFTLELIIYLRCVTERQSSVTDFFLLIWFAVDCGPFRVPSVCAHFIFLFIYFFSLRLDFSSPQTWKIVSSNEPKSFFCCCCCYSLAVSLFFLRKGGNTRWVGFFFWDLGARLAAGGGLPRIFFSLCREPGRGNVQRFCCCCQ